jgi:hypothetical protein
MLERGAPSASANTAKEITDYPIHFNKHSTGD